MASTLTRPTIIQTPWAVSGLKNTIPQTTATTGKASWVEGYPHETMQPIGSGGVPPDGKDENGVLYDLSNNIRFMLGGGQPRFNSTLSAAIGGYPVGAVLQSNDGASAYRNIVDGNTTNFNTTPASIGVSWMPYAGDALVLGSSFDAYLEAIMNRNEPVTTAKYVRDTTNLAACWGVCDGRTISYMGTNYTMPDWSDQFIMANGSFASVVGNSYGSNNAVVVAHSHTSPPHNHGILTCDSQDASGYLTQGNNTPLTGFTTDDATVTINDTGVSGTNANIPRSVAMILVQKFRLYKIGD